ncbi:nitroreductase family protein [Streptomyces sp. NPDC048419]|uniref:nitroreductase family protein n=1 Tax=Streptomyces sp. NPDC048419 TaxID=3365547 RepID=UPI00371C3CA4
MQSATGLGERTSPPFSITSGSAAMDAQDVIAVSNCISTLRAVRRFHKRPVPAHLIEFVIHHATRAGSGKNRQPWRFVVVREEGRRRAVVEWYRNGLKQYLERASEINGAVHSKSNQTGAAQTLAANIGDAPVLIIAFFVPSNTNPVGFTAGASIYPALQNLMLAARSVGLGSTMTTVQTVDEWPGSESSMADQLRDILGAPGDAAPAAIIPLGYPLKRFATTTNRLPVEAVTYADHWGDGWPATSAAPLA